MPPPFERLRSMKLLVIPALLLLVIVAAVVARPFRAATLTQKTLSEEGAQRLTTGAGLFALEAWDEEQILALQVEDESRWVEVNSRAGSLSVTEAPALAASAERVTVEVEGVRHRLLLDGALLWESEEEILGRPDLTPDGSWLVVARYPRGSDTAPLGELWRYDTATSVWTQLTSNGAEEASPLIAPDGARVGFLRDGDIWTVAATGTTTESTVASAPELAPLAVQGLRPPDTIRVIHVEENRCRPGVPVGRVDTIPFEEYVKRVTPHETPRGWHAEALKAQAVAARTYAWYKILSTPTSREWHVRDSTADQYMCDDTYPQTDAAVDATLGQHLTFDGKIILTMFSAENASPTKQNPYGAQYLNAVDDPLSFGFRRHGHGMGYSQWGGKRWADAGWSYRDILLHYYAGTQLWTPEGNTAPLLGLRNRPPTPYLRGSALWLDVNANAAEGTAGREWRPDGSGVLAPGGWQEDRDASNSWSHLFPLLSLSDTPEGNYRAEVDAIPSTAPQDRPVLRLGIDRTAPSLSASVAVEQGSGRVPARLTFQHSDSTSGVERVGWSLGSWQVEAERVGAGWTSFDDPYASGGRAIRLNPSAGDAARVLTFPTIALEPGHYRVWFRLFTNGPIGGTPIATLRVYDDQTPRELRAIRLLRASDFISVGWEWFYVDVDMTANYLARNPQTDGHTAHSLTAELDWPGQQVLEIDRLAVATRMTALQNSADLTLAPPENVTLFASDRAGNVALVRCAPQGWTVDATQSAEVGLVSVAEGSWRLFLPIIKGTPQFPPYQCSPAE